MIIDWWGLKYEETVNPQLVCPICQVALVKPTITPCGHTFCQKCIGELANSDLPLKCPIDRKYIRQEELVPAPFLVSGLVNDLVVHCPQPGCDFVDKRWLLECHLDLHCDYILVDCPGCDLQCERRWLKLKQCPHELQKCEECNEEIALANFEQHRNECTSGPWECPHCKEPFARADSTEHEQECEEFPYECPGKDVGCTFSWARKTQSDHAATCALALLAPLVKQQQEKIASLERESSSLKQQLDLTKRQVKRDAASLDMHILVEYDRMRTDLDHTMVQNDSNQKQMMILARENIKMAEDVGFLRSSMNSFRHQLHHLLTRRFMFGVIPHSNGSAPPGPSSASDPHNVKL